MKYKIDHQVEKSMLQLLGIAICLCIALCMSACKKDWLDVDPISTEVALNTSENTLSDYVTLMGNSFLYGGSVLPAVGSDDYYVSQTVLSSFSAIDLAYYLWAPDGFPGTAETNWSSAFQGIYVCDVALDGLPKLQNYGGNHTVWSSLYGNALFYRGWLYYQLAQSFMKQYDSSTAEIDLGIPLRLSPDVSIVVGRGTVQSVYSQILADLRASISLLPVGPQQYLTTVNRQAPYAVLAQTYLVMGDYADAMACADSSLSYGGVLLDFNSYAPNVTVSSTYGVPPAADNPEVFMIGATQNDVIRWRRPTQVDSLLFQSYDSTDLRKSMLFYPIGNGVAYRGNYDALGSSDLYVAPAVDELYLIRAECRARLGRVSDAMSDLNTLLKARYKTGTFSGLSAANADEALRYIITERRKELVMRGARWIDLRRLAKDPRFATTITRVYNGQTYSLTPGSNLYVWPIPLDEIQYSNVAQNPR